MDYVLKISSYVGLAPGAKHFRGRVEGEHPESCHGGTRFNAPEARGKTTCFEGHEMAEKIEWDVQDFWTEGHYDRWRASHYELDGPSQFLDEDKLIEVAVTRFTGDHEPLDQDDERYPRPQPGDRLFLGTVPDEEWRTKHPEDYDDHWGRLLAEIPGEK